MKPNSLVNDLNFKSFCLQDKSINSLYCIHYVVKKLLPTLFFMNKHVFRFLGGAVCSIGRRHRLFRPIRCSLGPQVRTESWTCSLWEQRLHGTVWGPEGHNRSVDLPFSWVRALSASQCPSVSHVVITEAWCLSYNLFPFTACNNTLCNNNALCNKHPECNMWYILTLFCAKLFHIELVIIMYCYTALFCIYFFYFYFLC